MQASGARRCGLMSKPDKGAAPQEDTVVPREGWERERESVCVCVGRAAMCVHAYGSPAVDGQMDALA